MPAPAFRRNVLVVAPARVEAVYRLLMATLAALIIAGSIVAMWAFAVGRPGAIGHDYQGYMDGARLWLASGSPYDPRTLAGPYAEFPEGAYLHPPIALPFMAVFLMVPWPLWWIVPIGLISLVIVSWRPPAWAWPVIALGAAYWGTRGMVATGNSAMWIAALLAAGLEYGWPAAFIAIKPTLAPLMLIGVRSRLWWATTCGLAVLAAACGPLWIQWVTAVRNAPVGIEYNSLEALGLFWIVGAAWLSVRAHREQLILGLLRRH